MPKRETTPKREKRRQDFQTVNKPESNIPPSEDAPEQEVTPEVEGEALETEGETAEKLSEPDMNFKIDSRRKLDNLKKKT